MNATLSPWRTALSAAVAIAATNIVVLGVGHLLGADMRVAQSADSAPTQVGVGTVVLMSVAPTILGGLALWVAARRGARAWRAVGWLGLALGLLTVPMPLTVLATAGTSATLASMHVVAGVVWFTAVRRAAAPPHDRPAPEALDRPAPEALDRA